MGDLIAAAKKGQGAVSYGSWGVGSPGHLGGEWLDLVDGTQMTHVPFREVNQLFTSVANGDPAWSLASIPSSQGIYRAARSATWRWPARAALRNARCAHPGRGRVAPRRWM